MKIKTNDVGHDFAGTSSGKIRTGDFTVELEAEELWLLKEKAIYWPVKRTLVVADLHLGKAGHFRRHGLPVPQAAHQEDYDRLICLLSHFVPDRLLILGDLFHSEYNLEWEMLVNLKKQFPMVRFQLIPGNHDILSKKHYLNAGLELLDEAHNEGPFCFTHDGESCNAENLVISGHCHPGLRLNGPGRQSLTLPAFLLYPSHFELPAFGVLTGMSVRERNEVEKAYVITAEAVLPVDV